MSAKIFVGKFNNGDQLNLIQSADFCFETFVINFCLLISNGFSLFNHESYSVVYNKASDTK